VRLRKPAVAELTGSVLALVFLNHIEKAAQASTKSCALARIAAADHIRSATSGRGSQLAAVSQALDQVFWRTRETPN